MKIAGRYARQFSRQSFTSLRYVQAGIAGYPNVRRTPSAQIVIFPQKSYKISIKGA
jgi:hypothetical protein